LAGKKKNLKKEKKSAHSPPENGSKAIKLMSKTHNHLISPQPVAFSQPASPNYHRLRDRGNRRAAFPYVGIHRRSDPANRPGKVLLVAQTGIPGLLIFRFLFLFLQGILLGAGGRAVGCSNSEGGHGNNQNTIRHFHPAPGGTMGPRPNRLNGLRPSAG